MNQDISTDSLWYLVTIDDPEMLSRESVVDMLKLIKEIDQIKFVIFDAIDAIGTNSIFSFLHENVDEVFEMEKMLEIADDIEHVEWADFFLFKECPNDWDNSHGELYPFVVGQADTTLRGIDDRFMYVYTQNQHLVDAIKSKYEVESITVDLLENLSFPE